jgi:propionyl-CoA synthetase
LYVMARTDDLINVAGHRISTGRIEEVLNNHPSVSEVAVVGKEDELKGQVPLAFINLHHGDHDTPENLDKELQKLIRSKIGPFAKLEKIVFVERLPKTRSGKIMRNLLRDISN